MMDMSYLPTLMDFPLQMSFNESFTDGSYGMVLVSLTVH